MGANGSYGDRRELGELARRLSAAGPARAGARGDGLRFAPRDDPDRARWELRSAWLVAGGPEVDEEDLLADESVLEPELDRWALASIEWTREGGWLRATVRLVEGGAAREGTEEGPAGEIEPTVARATAAAVAGAVGDLFRVELLDLAQARVAGQSVRLAALRIASPTGRTLSIGVASEAGGRDRLEAVARAVLDAANRRFRLGWASADAKVLRSFYAR